MPDASEKEPDRVHCRAGSLEIMTHQQLKRRLVHCRAGSLEKTRSKTKARTEVHCRAGSLENHTPDIAQ